MYGGAWKGPIFVLMHHPEDATRTEGVTFLNCDAPRRCGSLCKRRAARTSSCSRRPSAGSLSKSGMIDETDLHIAPVLLGEGIRLFDNPGR